MTCGYCDSVSTYENSLQTAKTFINKKNRTRRDQSIGYGLQTDFILNKTEKLVVEERTKKPSDCQNLNKNQAIQHCNKTRMRSKGF